MNTTQITLANIGRIGLGGIFLSSVLIDWKAKLSIFKLMAEKKVPYPWFFFIGATLWKISTSLALILNYYTYTAALLLALYIIIANTIFNNFWNVAQEQQDFVLALFMIHLAVCFGLLLVAAQA